MLRKHNLLGKLLNRKSLVYVTFVIALALILRLPNINKPFIGRHGWNEALYASITLDFVLKNRAYPYIVQFNRPDFNLGPLLYYITAPFIIIFGPKEYAFRIPVLLASLINILLIYKIGMNYFRDIKKAIFSAFIYAVLPLTSYYGVRYQHEELMFMFYLISVYYFLKYLEVKYLRYLVLSSFFFGVSVFLVKQSFIPFTIAYLITILYNNLNDNQAKCVKSLLIYVLSFILPFVILLILYMVLVPSRLDPLKWYLNRVFCGVIARIKYYNNLYISRQLKVLSSDVFIDLVKNFILAYGYLGILILLYIGVNLRSLAKSPAYNAKKGFKSKSLFLLLNLFIGFMAIYMLRYHVKIHDYYYYLVLMPLTIFSSVLVEAIFNSIVTIIKNGYASIKKFKRNTKKIVLQHNISRTLAFISTIMIVLSLVVPSYYEYVTFHDPFANMKAVEVGIYLKNITVQDDVVIVQSPVMGYYSFRPHLTWNYLWTLNITELHKRSLFSCRPILETFSVYKEPSNYMELVRMFTYWNPKAVVISPDVSEVIINHYNSLEPFLKYFYFYYIKRKVIPPYTIFIRRKDIKILYRNGNLAFALRHEDNHRNLFVLFDEIPLISIGVYFSNNLTLGLFKNSIPATIRSTDNNLEIITSVGKCIYTMSDNISLQNQNILTRIKTLCQSNVTRFVKLIIRPWLKSSIFVLKNKIVLLYKSMNLKITLLLNNISQVLIAKNVGTVILKQRKSFMNITIEITHINSRGVK